MKNRDVVFNALDDIEKNLRREITVEEIATRFGFSLFYFSRVGETYRRIYEEWLPETEYKLPYLFNFEHYGDACKGPYDEESESEIYIPVSIS